MSNEPPINRRILVIDDNQAIHEDYAKILDPQRSDWSELVEAEAQIFGTATTQPAADYRFDLDFALQGEDGVAKVRESLAQRQPYAVAFIDVRMPPGLDGIKTAARISEIDPSIQLVVCTAYSDYSWNEMRAKLGHTDRLLVLKKPFDTIEVLQLADTLTQKWQRAHDGNRHLVALQQMIRERSNRLNGGHHDFRIADDELEMAAQVANTSVRQSLVLEEDLRHALEAGELSVQYQPLIKIATQKIVGLEALARWRHPTKGSISPATFIPIAEDSGLILALGEFVLTTVCEQVARWELGGVPVVPVAVNISAVQLRRQNIVDLVRRVLQQTHMRPHLLVLELTESALIEKVHEHVGPLQALRGDGIGIEIDDFGTGYSSLSYLKELPIDAIKIDRSFIGQIDVNAVDAAIVSAIVAMAHSLQLRVVAEGVETAAQLQVLAHHGCDIAQGFLFARPLAADDCRKLLTASTDRSFGDTLNALERASAR